jgi:molecular chaperone HtpG
MTEPTRHQFQAQVTRVLELVINSLYSNKEIFLRELVSNAADALDKLRFNAITDPALVADDPKLRVRLIPDEASGTLTIWDNGVGMSRADLEKNLGTIAHSGSQAFLDAVKASAGEGGKPDVNLIGQFGVGFYSAFLVADHVEVTSRAAGSEEAFVWASDGADGYTIAPAERTLRGTSVLLHMKEDMRDYLNEWRLKSLVQRYSDYVSYPIELAVKARPFGGDDDEEADGEGEKDKKGAEAEPTFEVINQASALWQRPASEITAEQYEEFYKHLTHDWEPPLGHTHFQIEGTQLFTGLLFVPKRPPFGLFDPDRKHGVRLHVKRVFIMDECDDLLPRWLRFFRGVIDSDDLPLNVSRELLQDSRVVRTMRKQVIKKALDLLESLATDRPEDYASLWENYGQIIKEGLHYDPQHKDRLQGLVRFRSSRGEGLVSLDEYVKHMPEGQKAIYYAIGPSVRQLASSPHLEVLKKRGYEVLYLVDAIDQWAIPTIETFEEHPLVSATTTELDLGGAEEKSEESAEEGAAEAATFDALRERIRSVLDENVSEVRVSERLADSPACLVVPEGGLPSHIELMLRANNQDVLKSKRVFEINPTHPLIVKLDQLHAANGEDPAVTEWVELLFDQAVLAEGMPLEDPARLASRMTKLMGVAMGA